MNELKVFEGHQVEVLEFNGKVLFNPKHVAECLDIKNVNDNISRMNEKQVVKLTNSNIGIADFRKLHNTGENFLTESGVYKLIFKSSKPDAEKFQDWVTDEVLPSIRKNGIYATEVTVEKMLSDPDFAIELLTTLKEERAKRLEVEKTNTILMHVTKNYTATEIAKELGFKSATELNKILSQMKVQYKQNETWVLYSKYADKGYTDIKQQVLDSGRVVYDRKWTQLGRKFLLELFSEQAALD